MKQCQHEYDIVCNSYVLALHYYCLYDFVLARMPMTYDD
jgi:hypothetical protein